MPLLIWQVQTMSINPNYRKPKIVAGDLNTPVTFFEYVPSAGPDPGNEKEKILYECTALLYKPSMKDREILNGLGTSEGITIKIRDPFTDYLSTNKHKVLIEDYRYKDKVWEVKDVSYDFEDNNFVKVILGATS